MTMIQVKCILPEGKVGFYPPVRRRAGDIFEIEEDKFCESWMAKIEPTQAEEVEKAEPEKLKRGRRKKVLEAEEPESSE